MNGLWSELRMHWFGKIRLKWSLSLSYLKPRNSSMSSTSLSDKALISRICLDLTPSSQCLLLTALLVHSSHYPLLQIHGLATVHSGACEVKAALAAVVANHMAVNLGLTAKGASRAESWARNIEMERPMFLGFDGWDLTQNKELFWFWFWFFGFGCLSRDREKMKTKMRPKEERWWWVSWEVFGRRGSSWWERERKLVVV